MAPKLMELLLMFNSQVINLELQVVHLPVNLVNQTPFFVEMLVSAQRIGQSNNFSNQLVKFKVFVLQ